MVIPGPFLIHELTPAL